MQRTLAVVNDDGISALVQREGGKGEEALRADCRKGGGGGKKQGMQGSQVNLTIIAKKKMGMGGIPLKGYFLNRKVRYIFSGRGKQTPRLLSSRRNPTQRKEAGGGKDFLQRQGRS